MIINQSNTNENTTKENTRKNHSECMYGMQLPGRLATVVVFKCWSSAFWTTKASMAEERKAEYRQLVLDNYGEPEFFGGCDGFEDEWVGLSINENLPATTCSKRDFSGTNFLYASNAGPAVFAYEGLPIPELNLDIIKCRALLEENASSYRDFDLSILIRVLFLGDENSEVIQNLQSFLQEQYDNRNLRLWLTKEETQNL